MEWLPIETAPKDTKEMYVVRAFNVDVHQVKGYTSDPYCVWHDGEWFVRWPHTAFMPTHWMPLPPPPKNNTHPA